MENLWMCLNNLPCILPMINSYKNNDMITFSTIGYVASMSAISHLLENHKHGMPGFFTTNLSYFFNRLDVIGSVLTIIRFLYLYYVKYGFNLQPINKYLIILTLLSFMCLKISEYDNQNILLKGQYIFFHSLWHISIYPIMDSFLSIIY